MLGHEKAPHIAKYHQNVLVYGVDMKQIMLHLPDDFAKHPKVATQHGCLVHQPQRMGQAFGLHEHLAEGLAVHRVVAKLGIHQVAGVVQRRIFRKVWRLTELLRNFAVMRLRALYSARSVRADKPLMPTVDS